MTQHHWPKLRQHATELFNGETPRPELEQDILNTFHEQPQLVANAIEQIGAQFSTGTIRSGWAVLRTHINTTANPQSHATVNDTTERNRAIQRAEQWLKTAGIHFDRPSEVDDELFGDRGTLKDWANDEALRRRILQAWADQRHIGVRLEREQLVRLGRKRIKANRAARIAKRQSGEPDNLPAELQEPT
jgi:hypothetical protein